MEAIWRHLAGNVVGFEGDLATDIWLHSSRQAGGAYFATYLASCWAYFDECIEKFAVWPSAVPALPRRCLGAGPAEGAKPEILL